MLRAKSGDDFNVLAGAYEYARDLYQDQIEFLRGEGIDLGGIGMQCHFSERRRSRRPRSSKGSTCTLVTALTSGLPSST